MMKKRKLIGKRLSFASIAALAGLLTISAALIALSARQFLRLGRPVKHTLRMLTDPVPNRRILCQRIAAEAKKRGLDLVLSERSHPSLEVLKKVDERLEFDVAMVPGGVGRPAEFSHVRQAASLGTDPLHVLIKRSIAHAGAPPHIAELRGMRVNCGPKDSVLRVIAHDVLRFAGLKVPAAGADGDFIDESTSSADLLREIDAIDKLPADARPRALVKLPDAVIFLSPLPSLLARRLVQSADYVLIPVPFSEAYSMDRLNLERSLAPDDDGEMVDRASIVATAIPANLYAADPPVPPERCETLGTKLLLVANASADAEAVARLLEVIYHTPLTTLIQPAPVADQVPQFEIHPGAELYLKHRQPILTPDLVAQLGKLFGGIGALASGCVGLYGVLRILQLRRFEAYYTEVRRIAMVARGAEHDPEAPLEPLRRRHYLLDELDDLKSEAVRDFAEGGLKGEGLLAGVVALINDTRAGILSRDSGETRDPGT